MVVSESGRSGIRVDREDRELFNRLRQQTGWHQHQFFRELLDLWIQQKKDQEGAA